MLRKTDRERIFIRDAGICQYCTADLAERKFQIDHRIPKFSGGTDEDSNLLLSCVPCNVAKGVMSEMKFRHLLKALGLKWRDRRFKEQIQIYREADVEHPEEMERVCGVSNPLIGRAYREKNERRRARAMR